MPAPEADARELDDMLRANLALIADPDGRLPAERDLAARFGVGRTRLRRALAVLEGEGLLFRRHGQGTFTMPPPLPGGGLKRLARSVTPDDVMEVRMEVEPALAALAAERATPDDARALRELMAGTLTAETPEGYEIADAIFHFRIAELARNPLFLRVYDQIRSVREQSDWTAWRADRMDGARIQELGQQHEALVDRISAHDSAGVVRMMERHLLSIAQSMRRRWQSRRTGCPISPPASPVDPLSSGAFCARRLWRGAGASATEHQRCPRPNPGLEHGNAARLSRSRRRASVVAIAPVQSRRTGKRRVLRAAAMQHSDAA